MTGLAVHDLDTEEDQITLVVQGQQIIVRRSAIALVSKFFQALFSHEFQDSRTRVLHLDTGGQMGLTTSAVQVRITEFIFVNTAVFSSGSVKGGEDKDFRGKKIKYTKLP